MSKVHLLLSPSLCPFLVVPANSRDNTLDYVASLHHGNRLPVWCWSHPNTGVSLTRGGAPSIDDPSEAPDPKYSNCLLCITGALSQLLEKNAADYRTKPFCVHTQAGLEALCQFKGTKLQFVALKRHNSLSVCLSVCVSSYMYAVSMARNIGHQIENKGTATLDITRTCGTVWDLRSAFSNMRDLSMPGRPHPPHSSEVQNCHRFTNKFSFKLKNYGAEYLLAHFTLYTISLNISGSGSPQELAGLDRKWLTGMESAGWLPMVRNCLRLAKTVSQNLCIDHRPVFLQGSYIQPRSFNFSTLLQSLSSDLICKPCTIPETQPLL